MSSGTHAKPHKPHYGSYNPASHPETQGRGLYVGFLAPRRNSNQTSIVGSRAKRLYMLGAEVQSWLRLLRKSHWIRRRRIFCFPPPTAKSMRSKMWRGKKGRGSSFFSHPPP